jgi:pilus assembly protein CpaB
MNWKTWVPLVLAIVLGIVAAKAARDVLIKNRTAANNAKYAKVVVTRGDIQPGAALTAGDLAVAQVDAAHAPASAFDSLDKVVGRVSETLMVKGQTILEAMLAPVGSGSGLQALVPPGMRAITIEVNEFSGLAGLIAPGCRVDVIATINDGHGGADSRLAKTIVQNVKVTAVGQRTSPNGEPPQSPQDMFKSVTILASLEDAEAIELACAMGRPRLVLRGGRDNEMTTTVGVSMNDLKGLGTRPDTGTSAIAVAPPPTTAPIVVAPPPPTTAPTQIVQAETVKRRFVRVIRGGRVSMVSLTLDPEPEGDLEDGENLAGTDGEEHDPDDAVGSTTDPFDSK